MFQGTTPILKFKINTALDFEEIEELWVTFKREESGKILTITLDRLVLDNEEKTVSLSLTQEETLWFRGKYIEVQLRILTHSSEAYASPIGRFEVQRVLDYRPIAKAPEPEPEPEPDEDEEPDEENSSEI